MKKALLSVAAAMIATAASAEHWSAKLDREPSQRSCFKAIENGVRIDNSGAKSGSAQFFYNGSVYTITAIVGGFACYKIEISDKKAKH